MKALKFRIYDKDAKKFHYLEGVFNMPDPCYDGEVQQFTGLLDRLGKEIYEGDIVKCLHPKVLYQTNPEYDEVLHEIKWSTKEGRWTYGHSNFGSGGEIIGNIKE